MEKQELIPSSTDLAPPRSMVADVLAGIEGVGQVYRSADNFDGPTNNQLTLASLATGGGAESGDDFIGKEFTFKYWFLQPIELVDAKTGEVTIAPRVVLISKEGQAISYCSFGIARSLDIILKYKGFKSLGDGVTVEIKRRKTRQGFGVLFLVPKLE